MDWHSLGTLSPGLEWQSYPEEVFGYETLRVIHTWGQYRPVGSALFCQYFPIHGRASFRKLWAIDADPKILTIPIPSALNEAGFFVYTPQLKLGRFPHMGLESWQIELQAFY
jgi:hypothetical protein